MVLPDVFEAKDELLVYYGAADTVIGVAKARIIGQIPEEHRIVG
jgi:predicted GH43/DUF377 family glycosyl hydrolase